MCIIIDANRAGDFCLNEKPYIKTLRSWVNRGGKIVAGGKLETELFHNKKMRVLILEWTRNGTLVRISKDEVKAIEDQIKDKCVSDDPHVVALAIKTRAQIVVTEDRKLIQDLRNKQLVKKRRRIYKENTASPMRVDRQETLLQNSNCP